MDLTDLDKVLAKETRYRIRQAREAVFQGLIENWMEATSLPVELRKKLNKQCSLSIKAQTFTTKRKDVVKARVTLKDGCSIESVLLRHSDDRNTVCVSSQAGCSLACKFCATGQMKFERNLHSLEIAEQVLFFARYLAREKKRVSNVVFMGMGEPFLNYENVLESTRILNDKKGLNIGSRHISISTIGITEGIKKMAQDNPQLNLAVSLHAPNNRIRSQLIPSNKKYPIEVILRAVDDYIKKTRRKVMFEYLLIRRVNDSDAMAFELAKLMRKPLYFVNLILYNPTGTYSPSSFERVKNFKQHLKRSGIRFSQRYRFGEEVRAACGQLVSGSMRNSSRSSKRFKGRRTSKG